MINHEKVLQDLYNNIAKLGFGDLLLVQAQLSEHIHNCWQHHQLQREQATQPSAQALPETHPAPTKKPGLEN